MAWEAKAFTAMPWVASAALLVAACRATIACGYEDRDTFSDCLLVGGIVGSVGGFPVHGFTLGRS